MTKILSFLLVFTFLVSCKSDNSHALSEEDYLVFGHFYGMCQGEQCIETFKLTSDSLFEDALDNYGGSKFEFKPLDKNLYEKVKGLKTKFPEQLFDEDDQTFGCPDCADGGGLLIQLFKDGKLKTWKVDQVKSNVPEYLHDFMDAVNASISTINK